MRWASTATTGSDPDDVLPRVVAALESDLAGRAPDLIFAFLAPPHTEAPERILSALREAFPGTHVMGCGAGGVIGGGREHEQAPAVALVAGHLPGVGIHGFRVAPGDLPDPDGPPRAWHELAGVAPADQPAFVLLADPFSMPVERLLAGLDFAFPRSVTIGGLASAAEREGEQVLLHGDRVQRAGAVGIALMGDLEIVPAVAQGCRAVGAPMRITRCEENLLRDLDGQPVLDALQAALTQADERDRALAGQALFLGFETDPFRSRDNGPWLIRNLLGVDPDTRGIYVGEALRLGRRVRFHVRDREASQEDLERTLAEASGSSGPAPSAGLLFSCVGRGLGLYGEADHDSQAFSRLFGDVPLGGFFCSGEIGPVGKTTHLLGYTSAFALIRPRGGHDEATSDLSERD